MKNSDLRGLTQDLTRQTKEARKMGGPSDALKRLKKRPGGTYNVRRQRKDGYCFMGDIDPDLQPKEKWNWKPKK